MKAKVLSFVLSLSLIASILAGTWNTNSCNTDCQALQCDTSSSIASMECDGPDGVMLQ